MNQTGSQIVITGGEGDLARCLAAVWAEDDKEILTPGRGELDVSCQKSVRVYFARCTPELLVCSAGITRDQTLARQSLQEWDELIAVNYDGARTCAREAIEKMKGRGVGHVIFISSFSALHPPLGQIAYATAKAALLGLTKDLASKHGGANIRVNAVLPGFLETRMTENVTDQRKAEVLERHTLGRFNTAQKVATFIRFLHTELTDTSGQIFQLDSRIAQP